jgi:hypothetical protein
MWFRTLPAMAVKGLTDGSDRFRFTPPLVELPADVCNRSNRWAPAGCAASPTAE